MSFIQPMDMTQTATSATTGAQVDTLAKKAEGLSDEKKDMQDEKIWKVACGFEEIFIHMMLKQMRKTTWNNGFMGGGNEAKIYKDMFDSEIASLSSQSKELGLSRMIHDYLADRMNVAGTAKAEDLTENTTVSENGVASSKAAGHYQNMKNLANKQTLK